MKDGDLKEYMEYLPKDMLAEAAEYAPDGTSQAEGTAPASKGKVRRFFSSAAFRYTFEVLLVAAALIAGIVIAIRLGRTGKTDKNNQVTISEGTDAANGTEDIAVTPNGTEEIAPVTTDALHTSTGEDPTATPVPPTAKATSPVTDDLYTDVEYGTFDPPCLSGFSDLYISSRVKIFDTDQTPAKIGFYETVTEDGKSYCAYTEYYLYTEDGPTPSWRCFYDSQGREKVKITLSDWNIETIESWRYDPDGITVTAIVDDYCNYDSLKHSEIVTVNGNTRSNLSYLENGSYYTYIEYYDDFRTVKVWKTYAINGSTGDVIQNFADYYDENFNKIFSTTMYFNAIEGKYHEIGESQETTVENPAWAEEPVATIRPDHIAPAEAAEYTVLPGKADRTELFSKLVPETVKISGDKAYYSIRYEIQIGMLDDGYQIAFQKGKIYVDQTYLCDVVRNGDSVTLTTKSVYMTLDFTSKEDRDALIRTVVLIDLRGSEDTTSVKEMLMGNMYYQFGARKWVSPLFSPAVVNELSLMLGGTNGYLTDFSESNACAGIPDITSNKYGYDGAGNLCSYLQYHGGTRHELYYENGVLVRSFVEYNTGMTIDSIFGKDGIDVLMRTVDDNKETIREQYNNRPDLLYEIVKATIKGDSGRSTYTETVTYFHDESRTKTYLATKTTITDYGSGIITKNVITYLPNGSELSNIFDWLSDGDHSETLYKYYVSGVILEKATTLTNSEGKVERYTVIRYNENATAVYSLDAHYSVGYFSEDQFYDDGKQKIERRYDIASFNDPDREPVNYYRYYDQKGNITKSGTVEFVDGEWIEQ